MRILGVDPGTVRVGVSISDEDGSMAFPLVTVKARAALDELAAIVDDRGVERIVVGLPLRLDGKEGEAGAPRKSLRRRPWATNGCRCGLLG